MADTRGIRELAEQFKCTHCAGSGRVMMGALTSVICSTCDGFGTRRIKLSDLADFAESIVEQCAQIAEMEPELPGEPCKDMAELIDKAFNKNPQEFCRSFVRITKEKIAAAIRSRWQRGEGPNA